MPESIGVSQRYAALSEAEIDDAARVTSNAGKSIHEGAVLVVLLISATSANGQDLAFTDDLLPAATGDSRTYLINGNPDDTVTETVLPIFEVNNNDSTMAKTKPFENDSVELPTTVFLICPLSRRQRHAMRASPMISRARASIQRLHRDCCDLMLPGSLFLNPVF